MLARVCVRACVRVWLCELCFCFCCVCVAFDLTLIRDIIHASVIAPLLSGDARMYFLGCHSFREVLHAEVEVRLGGGDLVSFGDHLVRLLVLPVLELDVGAVVDEQPRTLLVLDGARHVQRTVALVVLVVRVRAVVQKQLQAILVIGADREEDAARGRGKGEGERGNRKREREASQNNSEPHASLVSRLDLAVVPRCVSEANN